MHLGSLKRDCSRLGPMCPGETVGWWMLDLARVTAGDKFVIIASPAEMFLSILLVGLLNSVLQYHQSLLCIW